MSTYVREKVLRIPASYILTEEFKDKMREKYEDFDDDITYYLEKEYPDLFDYGTENRFQCAPTREPFIDYVLDREWDAEGEFGKTRALYSTEKLAVKRIFDQLNPNIDVDKIRLVEFCWYNGCEAPDYYDEMHDPFYRELKL